MPKDALTRRWGRRPAGFCQEQTLVLTEQFSSVERDAFHVSYLSDKIPEAVFHGQAVRTVAYLRVSRPRSRTCEASASPSLNTHESTTFASTISSRRPPLDRLPKSAAGSTN